MLLYFLKMMNQKSNQICVQLLQTLSILFENIRNETSLCELERLNKINIKNNDEIENYVNFQLCDYT